eukprot:2646238-Prymnesium_polylepis.1
MRPRICIARVQHSLTALSRVVYHTPQHRSLPSRRSPLTAENTRARAVRRGAVTLTKARQTFVGVRATAEEDAARGANTRRGSSRESGRARTAHVRIPASGAGMMRHVDFRRRCCGRRIRA